MRNQFLYGILFLFLVQLGASAPTDSEKEASDAVAAVKAEEKEIEKTGEIMETANSEKKVKKEKSEDGTSSDEKLGTSSTIPVGFATANGISYDAPLTSGDYSAFGQQPNLYVQGQERGHHVQMPHHHGQPQILAHGGHGHLGGRVAGHGGIGGFAAPGQFQIAQHGHGAGLIQGGVAYTGHQGGHQGLPAVHDHGHVVGGPAYAQVHKGQVVQNSVEAVPGSNSLHKPYNPYGDHHGGVIYMGNGLTPEHVAGVKLAGPVLPPQPHGYRQHENVVISKGAEVDHKGNIHSTGVAHKSTVGHHGHNHHHAGHQQEYHVQQVHHQQNVHGFPPQVSVDTASRVKGVDPYGNVQNLKVKERFETGPGQGFNGLQNDVIANTDEAFVGNRRHHGPRHHYDGLGASNPDPYYNNEPLPYPGYRRDHGIGHATTLLTTGPNRYYQGKNPIGVYERYHRLG